VNLAPTNPVGHPRAQEAEAIAKQSREDIDNALAVLRERVDQEFQRTERLDNKSRQAFAVAAGFFALTQAAAFGSFGESAVDSRERFWLLVAAVLAVAALVYTAIVLEQAERLRNEGAVGLERVLSWCVGSPKEKMLTAWLVLAHHDAALVRVESNNARARQAKAVKSAAGFTLALCGTELILALAVRM